MTPATLQEDRQEIVLLLHDFTFRTPDEVLAGLTGTSPVAVHAMAERDAAGCAQQRQRRAATWHGRHEDNGGP